ncbi:restriction endonuclease fold toxin 5 domain-containing protein [Herbaspirillum huttiense]|uniref:Restriction endonuclease fold toxin 5 domain-containing protein n=2 Tax=Herbaspirillum huttiense TaxID=863372 RepID=A0AAJ2LYQ3_9BURK|nr:restriction endonuclease fold toxin 5 domain-containing protein [Herbaspirillum huttiense]MDR9839703.1 restriction endonuclease fold toxin 5 domain-containing protein [Herbaspirillum huttiense]
MATLAVPLIEGAVVRILAALGVGAVGAAAEAARERASKHQEEAEQAKSSPIARTEATTAKREKCKDCPPDKGQTTIRNHKWGPEVVAYQFRICGLPFGDGWITEWNFGGVDFDGFDSSECLLKEAKATYDQFFDDFGYLKAYWKGEEGLLKQAASQAKEAVPRPPVRLRWYFMQPKSYRYFSKQFAAASLPIETVFQP